MYFSKQQMISAVHNSLTTRFDEQERLCLSRFTPEQIDDYALDGDAYPIRCHANANMTLEFVTDSSFFGFEYDAEAASAQHFYTIDILIDGVLYDSRFMEGFQKNGVLFALPAGMHRVTVFLPWTAELKIYHMAIDDGAFISFDSPQKHRILAIGDSITQGYIAIHPSGTWVAKLMRDLDAEVLNLGVGGYGFFVNSLNHPTVWQADLVIVAYGSNDYSWSETVDVYRSRAQNYFSILQKRYSDIPILLILPLYRNDEKNRYREMSRTYTMEDTRSALREIANQYRNITVMETSYYPHHKDYFAKDYLHPNDLGSLIHGEQVVRTVQRILTT